MMSISIIPEIPFAAIHSFGQGVLDLFEQYSILDKIRGLTPMEFRVYRCLLDDITEIAQNGKTGCVKAIEIDTISLTVEASRWTVFRGLKGLEEKRFIVVRGNRFADNNRQVSNSY